jgi:WhiB family redox-sensing transcriptional regulator
MYAYQQGCRCDGCRAADGARSGYTPRARMASPGRWAASAACAGLTELMVADSKMLRRGGAMGRIREAKRVCVSCPVLDECREWALGFPDPAYDMVAGGLDPLERSRMRRGLRLVG